MTYVLDLDGTLIDSTARHYLLMEKIIADYRQRMQELADALGAYNSEEYMAYKLGGHSGAAYLTEILGLDADVAGELTKQWVSEIELPEYMDTDVLYDDTFPYLAELQSAGHDIIFLTSRANENETFRELDRLGIRRYAEECVIVNPGIRDAKLEFVKTLVEKGDKPVIVGDMETEYYIAARLGLPFYIVNRGFRSKKYLDSLGIMSHNELRL